MLPYQKRLSRCLARRLQARSAMEQETKNDMEAQNLDLRRQLAKLTTRLRKHPVFLGASLPDM